MSERIRKVTEAYEAEQDAGVYGNRVSRSNGDKKADESEKRKFGDEAGSVSHVSITSSGKTMIKSDEEGRFSVFVGNIPPSTYNKRMVTSSVWSVWFHCGYFHFKESSPTFCILCVCQVSRT